MKHEVEELLDAYESGNVSRTELIEKLAALATAPRSRSSIFRGRTINHITLRASDLERSRAFYQQIFGLPVISRTDDGYNLELEDSFLGIYQAETVGMCHFCIGIANIQYQEVMEKLKQEPAFLDPSSHGRRVFFRDPDGIQVQLSAVDYRRL
jgi:catechol 2,3-dioxygenase-like lactoylglutathione lyase family enzyme